MKNKSRTNETFGNDNKDIITIDTTTVEMKDLTKRIFHQKFGYGQVLSTDGDKLTILFEKAGEKKILAKYIVTADQTSHL